MVGLTGALLRAAIVILAGTAILQCSSASNPSSSSGDDGGDCYPDNDGVNDIASTVALSVSDTEFSRTVISTQNASTVTLTLTNTGTKAHGFAVGCTSVLSSYPDLPAGCASTACFPSTSTISALVPGQSTSVTFITPVPDNLVYPYKSNEPGDSDVPGLNGSTGDGWNLM
jgi:hypothetical protein